MIVLRSSRRNRVNDRVTLCCIRVRRYKYTRKRPSGKIITEFLMKTINMRQIFGRTNEAVFSLIDRLGCTNFHVRRGFSLSPLQNIQKLLSPITTRLFCVIRMRTSNGRTPYYNNNNSRSIQEKKAVLSAKYEIYVIFICSIF